MISSIARATLIGSALALCLSCCAVSQEENVPLLHLERAGSYGRDATFQVVLGDLDGDGDLDAVFSNMSGRSSIWTNDGTGRFRRSYERIGAESHGAAIGDLDGDGDEDIVLTYASTTRPTLVYWNDGSGRFTAAAEGFGDDSINANGIEVFDAEGDGDLDVGVYYASTIRHCRLYLNRGDGSFDAGTIQIPGLAAWGDVDNDGDVDAVTLLHQTNGGYGFRVLLNDGTNAFLESQHMPASVPFLPGVTRLGDLDGDGDLDLVGGGGSTLTAPITIFLNGGDGSFEQAATSFGSGAGRVTLGDMNDDGLVDVYLASFEQPQQIGLSNGSGEIVESGVFLGAHEMMGIGAIGDLDGDGDLDLFVSVYGQGGPNEVWLNKSD